MTVVKPDRLRAEGKLCLVIGLALIAVRVALDIAQLRMPTMASSELGLVFLAAAGPLSTVLFLAAPILVVVGFVLYRLGSD